MNIELKNTSYEIVIKKDIVKSLDDVISKFNKVLIIKDDNIPNKYAEFLKKENVEIYIFPHGEKNKSYKTYLAIINYLIKNNYTRFDLLIALGGGVTTDLVGYIASTFKRGMKYISIPTSLLAQVDSSIGGKCAINYKNYKNIIGSFYQPYKVFIDTNTLLSLPTRHFNNGLIEALKMALLFDKDLYNVILKEDVKKNIDYIVERSVYLKKLIVEQDELEENIRKVLNFGHTIGHALESYYQKEGLLHGEAVAQGLLYFIEKSSIKEEIKEFLKKLDIKINEDFNINRLIKYIKNDKKINNGKVSVIVLKDVGNYEFKNLDFIELKKIIERGI